MPAQTRHTTPNGTPVWTSGRGPTVVLAHGVLMDHRMWASQVEALSEHYRVCCFDMWGHGQAPDPPGRRTLEDFVTQVHDVVTTVRGDGQPVLGGFSMGGLIAQAYAIGHHTELCGLMLLNTVYDRTPQQAARVRHRYEKNCAIGAENAVESARERWFRAADRAERPAIVEEILGWILDGDFTAKCKAHRVFASTGPEIAGRLDAISCPALIMTGEDDDSSTPEMARRMAAEIPDSTTDIVPGQHHMMPVLDARRANAAILEFLGRVFGPLAERTRQEQHP